MTTTLPVSRTVRALQEAREVLRTEGWTQFSAYDLRGRCLIGALGYDDGDFPVASLEAARALANRIGETWASGLADNERKELALVIADWNDRPGRTINEVFALIDDAVAEELGLPVDGVKTGG